jgi:hypothetical protein
MRVYAQIVSRQPSRTFYAEEVEGSAEDLVVHRFGRAYQVRTVLRRVESSHDDGLVRDIEIEGTKGHVSPSDDLLTLIDRALSGPGAPNGRPVSA